MAKKNKGTDERKAPLMDLPLAISSLDGGDDLSGITRGINGGLLNDQQGNPGEPNTPEITETKGGKKGRPRKTETAIVEAKGDTDWERFEDLVSQYYRSRKKGVPVVINKDLINFFYRVKSVTDQKVDITNMLNAVIRLFIDKHKDYVNELLDQEIHRDV